MISKLVIDQVFLVRIVSVLDERDNLIVQWDKYAGGVYSERREMLNGRKTILLVEIVGGFLSGTDHQTAANFAGGDSIVLLYLKLLLKAINTEGIIYYQHILPTLDEEIALDTGEKSALVKLTISALCQYHAAVFLDDQSLQLLYLEDMVGSESASASRVRNHRANQKLLKEKEQATLQCNATVTESNTTEISGNPEIENSEKEEKKPKKEGEPEIEEIPSYFDDPVVNSMFFSYLEYRKEKGKEVKGKAIGYCIDKLESLSNSPVEQVAIIKQTIQNGWTDFFPLKGKKEKVSGSNVSSWLEREKIKSTGGVFGD